MSMTKWVCFGRSFARVQLAGAFIAVGSVASWAAANPIEWLDVNAGTHNFPSSIVVGQFNGIFGGLGMNYGGGAYDFNTGTGVPVWTPGAPFTSGSVSNAPSAPDFIALADFVATHTITFSAPVTNPVMAIIGLGTGVQPAQWNFDSPFDVLSFGPGPFGGPGTLTEQAGNVLEGFNGTGTIEFLGTFTSISWTATNAQPWQTAFTPFIVGLPVPAPASAVLLGIGGAIAARRGRRSVARAH